MVANIYAKTKFDVACACWFTSSGRTMPLSIKVFESGEVISIDNITVHSTEERMEKGYCVLRHCCTIVYDGHVRKVVLSYNKGTCRWTMEFVG